MRLCPRKSAILASGLLVLLTCAFVLRYAYDQKQLRAKRHNSGVNVCRANLRVIESAKALWATEHKKAANDVPKEAEIIATNYMHEIVRCPDGGKYDLRAVAERPRCSFHDVHP